VNIDILGLGENQLYGSVPPSVGNLSQMTALTINYNQLFGALPPEIENITGLVALFFGLQLLHRPFALKCMCWCK
jgi:hypothetical protein